jgi:hypothetical protein
MGFRRLYQLGTFQYHSPARMLFNNEIARDLFGFGASMLELIAPGAYIHHRTKLEFTAIDPKLAKYSRYTVNTPYKGDGRTDRHDDVQVRSS